MIRILILFYFFLGVLMNLEGQKAARALDSLNYLKETPRDSIIIVELNKVASLARLEGDDSTLCKSLLYLGFYYYDSDIMKYNSVVSESVDIIQRDTSLASWIVSSVYNNLASQEKIRESYLLSNEYYLKAIEVEKGGENSYQELATLYSNISFNYSQLGDLSLIHI